MVLVLFIQAFDCPIWDDGLAVWMTLSGYWVSEGIDKQLVYNTI